MVPVMWRVHVRESVDRGTDPVLVGVEGFGSRMWVDWEENNHASCPLCFCSVARPDHWLVEATGSDVR